MERGAILDKAKKIINGERQQMYGEPENSFPVIAELWNSYIDCRRFVTADDPLTAKDAAIMLALYKIGREATGAGKEDNLIDACGYLGLAADMSNYKQDA